MGKTITACNWVVSRVTEEDLNEYVQIGVDAEHLSTTHNDTPSPPQALRGQMTRACARNIENKVTSFLSEFRLVSDENEILPQRDKRVLRYIEYHREEARMKTQAPTEQEKEEEVKKNEGEKSLAPRVPGREDPGCPDSKTRGGPNPLDTSGARPLPGLRPAGPGCPAPYWASQPTSGARPTGPGCPASHLGRAQLHSGCPGPQPRLPGLHRPSHLRPPWVPGPPTPSAPDQSGCPAGFTPGARTPPEQPVCFLTFGPCTPLSLLSRP
nr:vegetative cell wall protein gp1-like [Aegilops tauschii subsp. strangulata]